MRENGNDAVFRQYWIRTPLGGWEDFDAQRMEDRRRRVLLWRTGDGYVFCPNHCRWERAVLVSAGAVTTEGGERFDCITVPFVQVAPFAPKNPLRGASDKEKRAWYTEKQKLLTDADGIDRDYVIFGVENDRAGRCCTVVAYCIERKRVEGARAKSFDLCRIPLDKQSCVLDTGRGRVSGRLGVERLHDKLPPVMCAPLERELKRNAEALAGRTLHFAHGVTGLLDAGAFARTPFELKLYPLVRYYSDLPEVRHDDFEGYNHLCAAFGLAPVPSLRRAFNANPFALVSAKYMRDYGFTDCNVVYAAISAPEDKNFFYDDEEEALNGIRSLAAYERHFGVYRTFCRDSIALRGESATLRGLLRGLELSSYDRADAARMYAQYRDALPAESRRALLRDGLSREMHDALSRFAWTQKNKNVAFSYTAQEKALEADYGSWQFRLARDSWQLNDIGMTLHNCVASYKDRVLSRDCLIVYAVSDGCYELCIEVRGDRVHQYRADYNATPKGEPFELFRRWTYDKRLTFGANRY